MQVSNQLYAPLLSFNVLEAVNTLKFTTHEITVSRVVNQLLQKFDLLQLDPQRVKSLKKRVTIAIHTLKTTEKIKVTYKTKLPHRTSYIVIIPSYKKTENV